MTVELIESMGSDYSVVRAARVSTGRDRKASALAMIEDGSVKTVELEADLKEATGLINFLMANRHGTPFEHNAFTFRVEAPIFVWREFHRHRVGFSYNELSGRYTQLPASFYVPDSERALTQVGKPGHYEFVPGTAEQYAAVDDSLRIACMSAYARYLHMLDDGVAKEVARMCLPVNIYSVCYVTCNARSIMSFLSLRTKDESSTFPSFPQREIEMVAEKIEALWAEKMPITAGAFTAHGRVSP